MMNILALDDDIIILSLIKTALENEDYHVSAFEKGSDALMDLDTREYDLIISDLKMPEMDGENFFNKVKEKYPRIPFIFLTANDDIETAVKIMKLGADEFLQKPLKGKELVVRVENLIQDKKKELLINKTRNDRKLEELDQEGIFSWKSLYREKDTEQANRVMNFLSRNIEKCGGFSWLDLLKSEIKEQKGSSVTLDTSLIKLIIDSSEEIRKILDNLTFVASPSGQNPAPEQGLFKRFSDRIRQAV